MGQESFGFIKFQGKSRLLTMILNFFSLESGVGEGLQLLSVHGLVCFSVYLSEGLCKSTGLICTKQCKSAFFVLFSFFSQCKSYTDIV